MILKFDYLLKLNLGEKGVRSDTRNMNCLFMLFSQNSVLFAREDNHCFIKPNLF